MRVWPDFTYILTSYMHVCVTNAQGSGMMSRFYRIMSGVCVCIPESS